MKISVPILYFQEESERRNAVENTYKQFEECGIPYIAVLVLVDKNQRVHADYELINITPEEAKPYRDFVQGIIDDKVNRSSSIFVVV